MSERFEYIEAYFENRLDGEEKRLFEARCEQDEPFAREVSFYLMQRQAMKEELLRQKRAVWESLGAERSGSGRSFALRGWSYGVAASVLLVLVLYLTESRPSPRRLAGAFIENNFSRLSQTMNGPGDSLQQGIAAYNRKNYSGAVDLFTGFARTHPENSDAMKYCGIVYLRLKDYDKALERFDALARTRGLFSNPGLFLEAVTLLQRDAAGDKRQAKDLLTRVVEQQLEGSQEAVVWLSHF